MPLELTPITVPAPVAGVVQLYPDSADNNRLKAVDPAGVVHGLSNYDLDRNYLINGGFDFAQRQVPTTLTAYAATADRTYAFDRWGLSVQTSSLQAQQVETLGTPETGLEARNYLKLKQITNAGKFALSQVIEGVNGAPLRGRTVRVQFKAKYSVASSMTVRMAVIELGAGGTIDTITNPWTTAWGANGTDPTFGANLTKVAPTLVENGSIVSGAAQFVLTSGWVRYGGTFTLSASARNFIVVVWSNSQLAINDEFNVSQVGLYDSQLPKDWMNDDIGAVLRDCQRYYCKTFDLLIAPAASTLNGVHRWSVGVAGAVSGTWGVWRFPVAMRVAPTIVFFNPAAAGAQARQFSATAGDCTATAAAETTQQSVAITTTPGASAVIGSIVGVQMTASAEL